jgi:hypothetical protein
MSLSAANLSLARGFLADPGTSAVQSIQIDNAIGGTFTASFDGQTTSALDFNAGANELQNALAALSNIGTGNVAVQNTAPYVVYLTGDLGNAAQSMLTVDDSNLVGTGVIVTVSQVTAGGVTAFSDDELNALYDLAVSNLFLTISYGFRELKSNAARFNRYTAGQTQEFKEQIFDHLSDLADDFERLSRAAHQVQSSRMEHVPPELRAVPVSPGVPATSLRYGPNGALPWRRGGW